MFGDGAVYDREAEFEKELLPGKPINFRGLGVLE